MKHSVKNLFAILLLAITTPAMATLNIFACEPEWASLSSELGGDRVSSFAATTAFQDPHHIQARPSLIAKVRRADLVVCSGAELEIGWLPMLQRQAGNSKILNNQPGYFEAAMQVDRLEIPTSLDRSQGDVHAAGNPHVHLDPRRLLTIAKALSARMRELSPDDSSYFAQRLESFEQRWQQAMQRWQQQAKPLKGVRVVVHHRDWVYLFDWLGIELAGALEPKPGLPVTAGHLSQLKENLKINPARMIVHTTYQNPRAAERLSQLTSIPVVQLPYTIGGDERATDLFGLFDITIEKLTGSLR